MRNNNESLHNFDDIHTVLKNYIPPIRSNRGAYTLERMQSLMAYLGNPQNKYKVIHVAGTSGKTSTCYYIASFLKQSGIKAGLTVSPHIDEINERVQINLKPLAEKTFAKEFSTFFRQVKKSGINPTYFEILSAFAFWEFSRQKCEYVIVEVGLGGLLDATNVISSPDKTNVITDIGLDHQEVLGKTRALIASQKSGIIHPHNTVISYEQDDEVMSIIRETANQQQAELHEIWPVNNADLPTILPLFQRRNWYLAYSTYQLLMEKYGLPELSDASLFKTVQVNIPARMEIFCLNKSTLIIDGSHNQQKLKALVKSIKHAYPRQKFVVLFSLVSTKQTKIKNCLKALLPITQKMYLTSFKTENNEKISIDPIKIVAACEDLGFTNWEIATDPVTAYKKLCAEKSHHLLITGSFYLLNDIRPQLQTK